MFDKIHQKLNKLFFIVIGCSLVTLLYLGFFWTTGADKTLEQFILFCMLLSGIIIAIMGLLSSLD